MSEARDARVRAEALRLEAALKAVYKEDPRLNLHSRLCFEVISELGEGGMGRVVRVKDTRLGREAALKLVSAADPTGELARRFQREAEATARLDHPGIPPVYEAGRTPKGQPYLLMRVVTGRTLRVWLKEELARSTLRARLQLLLRIAETIAYAHAQGVAHRDLKPENIMVGEHGEVTVMDWGISVEADVSMRLTREGALMGTPGYAAPEQLGGLSGPPADVFALGCLLTELTTGERAIIGGDGAIGRIAQAASGAARTPRQVQRGAPAELDAIARAALDVDPETRTTAAAFVEQLSAWLEGRPVPGLRLGLASRLSLGLWRRRGRLALLSAGLAASLAAGLGVALVELDARERGLREQAREHREALQQAEDEAQARGLELGQRGRAALDEALARSRGGASDEELEAAVDAALALTGRASWALTRGGEVLAEAQRPETARALLEEAAREAPPAYAALLLLHELDLAARGLPAHSLRETPPLTELTRRAAEAPAEEPASLLPELARLAQRGAAGEAARLSAELVAKAQGALWARRLRARLLYEAGALEPAGEEAARILAIDPRSPLARLLLGAAAAQRGELSASAAWLREGLALASRDKDLRAALAEVLLRLEQPAEVLELTAGRPDAPRLQSARGAALSALGRPDEALPCFNQALDLDPALDEARARRIRVLLRLGQDARALLELRELLLRRPDVAEDHELYARVLLDRDDPEGAREAADRAVNLDGAAVANRLTRARARWRSGDPEGALKDLSAALQVDPNLAEAFALRGEIREVRGDLRRAQSDYERALILGLPRAEAVERRLAGLRESRMRSPEARRALDEDIAREPTVERLLERAGLRYEEQDWAGASDDTQRALELSADAPPEQRNYLLKRLALIANRAEDFEGAVRAARAALEITREDPASWYQLGLALGRLGQGAEAVLAYTEVLKRSPKDVMTLFSRGSLLRNLGRAEEALTDLDAAVALKPTIPQSWANRGYLQLDLGRLDAAAADFEQALSLAPKLREALLGLARVKVRAEQPGEARILLTRIPPLPQDYKYWSDLGAYFLDVEDYAQAAAAFSQVLSIAPGETWAYASRAEARIALGELEAARADLEAALNAAQGEPERARLKQRLEALSGAPPR